MDLQCLRHVFSADGVWDPRPLLRSKRFVQQHLEDWGVILTGGGL
jgi:hypothetical protein